MNPNATTNELKASLKRQANRAMKRIRRMEEAGIDVTEENIPAKRLFERLEDLDALTESGNIRTSIKDRSMIKKVLKETEHFLDKQTSSLTGIKQAQKHYREGWQKGMDISAKQASALEDLYRRNKDSEAMKKYFYEIATIGYNTKNSGGDTDSFLRQLAPLTQEDILSADNEYRGDLMNLFRQL